MRRQWRPASLAIRGREGWSMMGLAGMILLLVGCGVSEGSDAASGTGSGSGVSAAGHVTVTTSKPQYRPDETVDVTITNGLSSGILAADHQSNCTVLLIEHLAGQTWQAQNPCLLKSPTRLIAFGAGTTTQQQLQPPSGQNAARWPAGSYRIALTYRQSLGGPETTVYSAQLTVA